MLYTGLLINLVTYHIHSCSILSAEFMRISTQDTRDKDAVIVLNSITRARSLTNGNDDEVSIVSCNIL